MFSRADSRSRIVAAVLAEFEGSIRATIDDDWVALAATLHAGRAETSRWRVLEMNASFVGGVRVSAAASERRLRADLPLVHDDSACEAEDDAALGRRVRDACGSIHDAIQLLGGAGDRTSHAIACKGASAVGEDTSASLAELCAALAWPFVERSPDSLTIDLDVGDRFAQAHVARDDMRAVRIRCDLIRRVELGSPGGAAISLFLLDAADGLRMARPAAERTEKGFDVRLEVCWPGTPLPAELACALEALSVGWRTTSREVDALRDESVALTYLRMRGLEKWDVLAA